MACFFDRALPKDCSSRATLGSTTSALRLADKGDWPRHLSHKSASTSGREYTTICKAWLGPQSFDTSKLSVKFLSCASEAGPRLPAPRKYTLTHSDITGQLWLTVGQKYNNDQLSGWYMKLFRDEVLAEWLLDDNSKPQLHLFCHISSSHRWSGPIPPALRSKIFQMEMPLVLKTLMHGDSCYLRNSPNLMGAPVYLHLSSHVQALNLFLEWGVLGDESSWKQPASSWFDIWWKKSISTREQAYASLSPQQELLQEAAKVERGQLAASDRSLEKPSVDLALSSAPAACSRAAPAFAGKAVHEEGDLPCSLEQEDSL